MKVVEKLPVTVRTITLENWAKEWPEGRHTVLTYLPKEIHLQVDDGLIVSFPKGNFQVPTEASNALRAHGGELVGYYFPPDPELQKPQTRSLAQSLMAQSLGIQAALRSKA